MAELRVLTNATTVGTYLGQPAPLSMAEPLEVVVVTDLTMTMTADKTRWADPAPITYMVTIINGEGNSTYDLSSLNVTGFTGAQFNLIPTSIVVTNNITTVSAAQTFQNGILSLTLQNEEGAATPAVIASGTSFTAQFQFSKTA